MTPAPPAGGAGLTPAQRRLLTVLLMPLFLALMGVSIVNVALPALQEDLQASSADLQWVLAGYTLTFGVVLVAAGRAGDLWGRKRLFVAGIALFTLGQLASGLALSPGMVNAARLATGVGAGLFNPQIVGMIQSNFTGRARGLAYGLFGTVIGLAVAVGPLLGGLMVAVLGGQWGWRGAFLVNVPVGLAALTAALRWLPSDAAPRDAEHRRSLHALDPIGGLLLGVGTTLLMLPFILRGHGWLAAIALVLLVGWWVWENRMRRRAPATGVEPMVDPALFRRPSFTYGAVGSALFLATMPGIFAVVTLFLQQGMGLSALAAGLMTVTSALVVTALSSWVGARVEGHGAWFAVLGAATGVLALALLAVAFPLIATGRWPAWTVAAILLLQGVAQAFYLTTVQVLMMHDVTGPEAGAAGGIAQTMQRVGSALGLAVVTGVFFGAVAAAGPEPGPAGFGHAAALAMGVVAVTWAGTLAVAVADLVRRRRRDRAADVTAGTGRAADER
ncbi:MFS transporter [Micrococcus sp.]|uniref:MFS transporter n=1 Tax=Micrococcus sp. TaxID=1271 RepID=UPI002A9138FA|nr:MFS transporter [Micrococcus sp.]MDY6054497.1 MFS transporter [Micrococcus sp.]